MPENIPFAPPRIDQAIIDEVTDTLKSGWITTGPRTKALEKEIQLMTRIEKVLCVNSATAGMELILRFMGIGPGDEVIIPAYTYCATANVVVHCGARPLMVDINPLDGCMDLEAVRRAVSPRTKAIIPVDLAGLPIDYLALRRILEEPEIQALFHPEGEHQQALGRPLIMADAAHSLGARLFGKSPAIHADATVFSFHAVKNLTTAEGGAICLNFPAPFDNEQLYSALNRGSLHGQSKDALAKFGGNSWEYDVLEAGYKCNMPDVLAAIGLVEARRYESETLPRRIAICQRYATLLSAYSWAELPVLADADRISSAHLFLLRIRGIDQTRRNRIIQKIFDSGVSVNVHYKPLPMLSFYKEAGYDMAHYPNATDFFEREITLPVFFDLTDAQQDRVVQVLVSAVETELHD
ncbi:MAG: DegT/DnrJ/EryC1/StrS aminotransferase family protein [Saprospiraceae bacterium]|nr:DegT/DnrJ/EryC1/StrS aminotransferase family protein [Saprospiraceae bacterium]